MVKALVGLAQNIEKYLKKHLLKGRTVTLKVKYYDFKLVTRSSTPGEILMNSETILKYAILLLDKTDASKKSVRLLGISISNFP